MNFSEEELERISRAERQRQADIDRERLTAELAQKSRKRIDRRSKTSDTWLRADSDSSRDS
ncbi:hypothetical protein [Nevskia soli]|uniref:hypothetical protein n=1 Tax=Nevskia soli TaxID=418856 RepID=UPI0015D7290F|nr:hypothetical protein [Nevskia soli]